MLIYNKLIIIFIPKQNDRFYKIMENFNVEPLLPNVMCTFVVGQDAVYIEDLSDDCLIEVFYYLFCMCFPKLGLPRPSRLMRSKWYRNPFTRGTYSYKRYGFGDQETKNLAKPLVIYSLFALTIV